MTVAGAAVATVAAALTMVGFTGGCSNPTDVTHLDQPRTVAPAPAPPPRITPIVGGE